jgi:hypothetical protein
VKLMKLEIASSDGSEVISGAIQHVPVDEQPPNTVKGRWKNSRRYSDESWSFGGDERRTH